MDVEQAKKEAGIAAVQFVESGMYIGLGTGSTVKHTVIEIGRAIREDGLEVTGVPTSIETEKLAIEHGIPLSNLTELGGLDLVRSILTGYAFENFWADSNSYPNQITAKSVKGFLKNLKKNLIQKVIARVRMIAMIVHRLMIQMMKSICYKIVC